MQHLLARAVWDTDAVAADVRDWVIEHLADPDGVLITDETGDLKKGAHTVGVQRQYTGTAGRIENAQVGVYLAYAGRAGHAVIDRELYLPRCWAEDPDRRAAAKVPADVAFATKPALAAAMIGRAVQAGVPARWVTGDEVYGADPALRAQISTLGLATCWPWPATTGSPSTPSAAAGCGWTGSPRRCPSTAGSATPPDQGRKGPRYYLWALVEIDPTDAPGQDRLLVRRHPDHGELAFYRCHSPRPVGLPELVRVAGTRWRIEEAFQAAKGLTGLDEHQVRRWTSWRRWTLLAITAHALLAVLAATERTRPG